MNRIKIICYLPIKHNRGLLGSLMGDPTARLLIGANILGAGVKGSDPFSAITPAVLQTAQIQKALTPKAQKPFEAKDTKSW